MRSLTVGTVVVPWLSGGLHRVRRSLMQSSSSPQFPIQEVVGGSVELHMLRG